MSTRRRAKRNWPRCASRSVVAGPSVMSPGNGGRRGGWGWSRRCVRAAGRANRGLRMPEKDSRPLFFVLLYQVLDHDPDHADITAFLLRFRGALAERGLTLQGVTTDASPLYPEPLRCSAMSRTKSANSTSSRS